MSHSFKNDYNTLIHEEVLKALIEISSKQNGAYGLDEHSERAAELIKKTFECEGADVHFVAGGTQANMLVISYALKPYEAVIACDTGHINVHETGAVEGSGHKVYTVKNSDGKITPRDIKEALRKHTDEHMVKPRMVYIANSTETGTIYSKEELQEISDVCKINGLYLFMDGARLGSALTSDKNDVEVSFIAKVCDAFYVGGTKNGMMIGEAIVLVNDELKEDFRYHIKNKGAMLAKGYLIGAQFEAMFKNNLYFDVAKKTNEIAVYIKSELQKMGVELVGTSPTNQIFVRFKTVIAQDIINKFGCELWDDQIDNQVIRIVTSFATTMDDAKELLEYIKGII